MRRSAPPAERAQAADVARAARILHVRARREVPGAFTGNYASAFRGGGLDFEESRPYAPGDDIRAFDWNALARTGEPFVKHFRRERDQTLLLALDVSRSMGFASCGRSKAQTAAHSCSLLAAAAGHAGDRVGFLAFDSRLRAALPAARGPAAVWRVIAAATRAAAATDGSTNLAAAAEALRAAAGRRAIAVLLSDFRVDPHARPGAGLAPLAALAIRHDLVCVVIEDPRDTAIPDVGPIRLGDPEHPGRRVLLDSGSPQVRERYRRAAMERRESLARGLRAMGAEVVRLRTDRNPLGALARFFRARASHPRLGR